MRLFARSALRRIDTPAPDAAPSSLSCSVHRAQQPFAPTCRANAVDVGVGFGNAGCRLTCTGVPHTRLWWTNPTGANETYRTAPTCSDSGVVGVSLPASEQ